MVATLSITIFNGDLQEIETKELFPEASQFAEKDPTTRYKLLRDQKIDWVLNADSSFLAFRFGDRTRVFETDNFKLIKEIKLPSASEGFNMVFTRQNAIVIITHNKYWVADEIDRIAKVYDLNLPPGDYAKLQASVFSLLSGMATRRKIHVREK